MTLIPVARFNLHVKECNSNTMWCQHLRYCMEDLPLQGGDPAQWAWVNRLP